MSIFDVVSCCICSLFSVLESKRVTSSAPIRNKNGGRYHRSLLNPSTGGSALSVAFSGNYAYVADLGDGLDVIDISNPSSPTLAGTYNTSGSARDVTVSGNYAYIADWGASRLRVVDITNPAVKTPKVPICVASSRAS